MDEASAIMEKPLDRIPVDVVRERNWHFVNQREHAIEISAFMVVALKPCDLLRGQARALPKRILRIEILLPLSSQCQRSFVLLVRIVLDIVVRKDRRS